MLTIYGALAIPLGPDGAFGVLGALFLVAGICPLEQEEQNHVTAITDTGNRPRTVAERVAK